MNKIYVASPVGLSDSGRHFLYGVLVPKIKKAGFEIIDP
jgi:hypothetical protein